MPDQPNPKRGRNNDDETEPNVRDVISLLQGVNSKLDILTASVSDNSMAINNIDVRLTSHGENR